MDNVLRVCLSRMDALEQRAENFLNQMNEVSQTSSEQEQPEELEVISFTTEEELDALLDAIDPYLSKSEEWTL